MNANHPIRRIPEMLEWDALKLEENSIRTTLRLLNATGRLSHRQSLSIRTGIHQSSLLRYANAADLMRIHGLGSIYVGLLQKAGIPSVGELSVRNADNLYQLLKEVAGDEIKLLPALSLIKLWIDDAKILKRVIHYRYGV